MMDLIDLNEIFEELYLKNKGGSRDKKKEKNDRINRRRQLEKLFDRLGVEKKYREYIHKDGEHYYIYRDDKAFVIELLNRYGKSDYKFKNIDKETKDPKENGKKNFILNGMCNLFGNLGVENEELSILRDKICEAMHYKENPLEGQLNDMAGRIALSVRDSIYKYRGTVTDEDMMCWIVNMKEDILRYKEEKWDAVLEGISDTRFYEKKETDRNTSIKNTEELLKEIIYEVEETMRPEQRIFSDVWLENQSEEYKQLVYATVTDKDKENELKDLADRIKGKLLDYNIGLMYGRDRNPFLRIVLRNNDVHVMDISIFRSKSYMLNIEINWDSSLNPNYNGDAIAVIDAFICALNNGKQTVESDTAMKGLVNAFNELPRSKIYNVDKYRVMLNYDSLSNKGEINVIKALHTEDVNIQEDLSKYKEVSLKEINEALFKEKDIHCSGIVCDIAQYYGVYKEQEKIKDIIQNALNDIKDEQMRKECRDILEERQRQIEGFIDRGLSNGRDIQVIIKDEDNDCIIVYAGELEFGDLIKVGEKYDFYGESIRIVGNAGGGIYLKHLKYAGDRRI